MPVPRQRLSARRGRTRASHHALVKKTTLVCPNCSKAMLPHRACAACGYYKGKNVRTKITTTPKKSTSQKAKAKPAAEASATKE